MKRYIFVVILALLFSNIIKGGNLIVKIITENPKRVAFPNFDFLVCQNSSCSSAAQFPLKKKVIKKSKNEVKIKDIPKGYYLFVPKENSTSLFYFDNKTYRVFIPAEEEDSELILRELLGGGIRISCYDKKERVVGNPKSKFLNIWLEDKKGENLFYSFDTFEKNISINGIPEGNYKLYVLFEGYGLKEIKDVRVKKGKIKEAIVNISFNSKTGVKGEIKGFDKFGSKETILSLVELIKKEDNKKYGVALVKNTGKFKIIDVPPGKYQLFITIKNLNSSGKEISFILSVLNVKIKKNKIVKITEVIDEKINK